MTTYKHQLSNTINNILADKYSAFVNFLLFLFPIFFMSLKGSGELILFILMLIGIKFLFVDKINPFKQQELKLLSTITLIYFAVVLLSIIFSDDMKILFHYANRELHFLFAPLVALTVFKANINQKTLILAIKLSLILIGGLVLYQNFNGILRPSWVMNPNVIGNLMVLLLFMSWVNISTEKLHNLLLTFFSSALGVSAIILSGTRGAWVSFLVLLIVLLFLLNYKKSDNNKKFQIILLGMLIIIGAFAMSNNHIKNRITLAMTEINNWNSGKHLHSSVGLRLEMYKSGILATKERPIIGYGYRNTNKAVAKFADKSVKSTILSFNHLHNTYINSLVFGGVIALFSLLALLFLPLRKFWHTYKNNDNEKYSLLGILLCVGYANFGMTGVLFGDTFMNSFYVFFLAVLLPKVFDK
jgi:O-antigen ligase